MSTTRSRHPLPEDASLRCAVPNRRRSGSSGRSWSRTAFENVQRWRRRRGLTVDELVTAVRRLGLPMSRRVFYDIANRGSEREPSLEEVLGFAVALEVSPTKLLLPGPGDPSSLSDGDDLGCGLTAETLAWWLAEPDRRPPVPPDRGHGERLERSSSTCAPPGLLNDDPSVVDLLREVSTGTDFVAKRIGCDIDAAYRFARNTHVALITVSSAGVIETANEAAGRLCGRRTEDLVGMRAVDLLVGPLDPERPPAALPARLLGFDGSRDPGYVGRVTVRLPGGNAVLIALAAKAEYGADGEFAGYSCAAHRLASRSETAGRSSPHTGSRRGPRSDGDRMPGEVCTHLDGTIYLFSPRAEEICGLRAADAVGRVWKQIGLDPHLDTSWYSFVHSLFSYGHASWDQAFRKPNGTEVRLHFDSRLQYDATGDPDGTLTFLTLSRDS